MFNKSKIAAIVLMTFLLNACSTGYNIPENEKLNNLDKNKNNMIDEWRKVQSPIQFIQTDNNFLISRKNSIPDFIQNIQIENLNLYKDSTFEDLIGIFSSLGVQLAIKEEMLKDKDSDSTVISDSNIKIHNYTGSFINLVELLENTYNLSFNYQTNNIITLEKRTLYIASVPQNKEVIEQITKHVEAMGALDINVSQTGGFLLYRASKLEQDIIKEYLDSFYKNFASVKLQLAVISVNLNKSDNSGFDWSKFSMQLGNLEVLEGLEDKTQQNTVNNGTGGVNTPIVPTNPVEDVSYGSNLKDLKSGVSLSGTNGGLVIKNDNFSLNAVYNLLNTYGNTETTQSIYVESTSGSKIELRSGQEIPYVSGINSNVTTGGGAGVVSNGAQTEKIEVGLEIKALPFYDFTKDLVTLEIEMDLKSLIGFVELNAGNGNGNIKQPQTQTQKFNSVLKIRPGEAALVGGISYDVLSDSRSNLTFLMDRNTASRNFEITKSSMFLLLRPTVSVFADFESEIKQQQEKKVKQLIEKENQRKIIEERKIKELELKNKEIEENKKIEQEKNDSLEVELKKESQIIKKEQKSSNNLNQNINIKKENTNGSN